MTGCGCDLTARTPQGKMTAEAKGLAKTSGKKKKRVTKRKFPKWNEAAAEYRRSLKKPRVEGPEEEKEVPEEKEVVPDVPVKPEEEKEVPVKAEAEKAGYRVEERGGHSVRIPLKKTAITAGETEEADLAGKEFALNTPVILRNPDGTTKNTGTVTGFDKKSNK